MNRRRAFSQNGKSRRGVALLLVLGSLVLLGALLLAFLGGVKGDLKTSKIYADGSSAKTLADSAVNLVMAQISQATSNAADTWASQPGMIRTYDSNGALVANYKLYSWDTLKTTTPFDISNSSGNQDAVPANWYQNKALFVDMNSPVVVSNTTCYPILDPPVTTSTSSRYYVEGFSIDNSVPLDTSGTNPNPAPMPVKWLYVLQNGKIVAPQSTGSGTSSQVAIPGATAGNPIVGRMAFWTDDESCKININTASEGAYWDTPRTVSSYDRSRLSMYQPAQKEYQRYPGHPLSTSLSPVLGSLMPVDHTTDNPANANSYYSQYLPYYNLSPKIDDPNQAGSSQAGTAKPATGSSYTTGTGLALKDDRLYATVDEMFYKSDLQGPSSFSGTRTMNVNRSVTSNGIANTVNIDTTMLAKSRFFLTADSRSPDVNLFNRPRVGIWPVNATNDAAHRTIFDQTIAFCGTINNNIFYFQRDRSDHPTNDLPSATSTTGVGRNRSLIQYLQYLTSQPIPGFGGSFSIKYPNANGVSERDQILTEIFDYIRSTNLLDQSTSTMTHPFAPTASAANGIGGSRGYNGNYYSTSAGFGQVVPIYDSVTNTRGFGRFPTVAEVAIMFIVTGWNDGTKGSWSTSDPNFTKLNSGKGNIPFGYYGTTGTDGTLVTAPGYVNTTGILTASSFSIPAKHVRVQAIMLINLFDPSSGLNNEYGTYRIQLSGLDSFTLNGINMGFPSGSSLQNSTTNMPNSGATWAHGVLNVGGNMGFRPLTAFRGPGNAAPPADGTTTFSQYYPFFSQSIDVPYDPSNVANPGTMQFTGGKFVVNILLPGNTPASLNSSAWSPPTPIQTITLNFANGTFPIPVYAGVGSDGSTSNIDLGSFGSRCGYVTNPWSPGVGFIRSQDVVRSVRAYPGDIRLIAAKQTIDATQSLGVGYFDVNQDQDGGGWPYSSSSVRAVHNLQDSGAKPFYGAWLGQLVPGVNYQNQPSTSTVGQYVFNNGSLDSFCYGGNNPTSQGAFIGGGNSGLPGDWDNGFAFMNDGPYINKADDGDFNYSSSLGPYFNLVQQSAARAGTTYFSPNRLMPSPVMFGSLPTGVIRNIPWMTLLFCPDPAAGDGHPGFGQSSNGSGPAALPPFTLPPDYLWLDLFNMPIVEPYPISEPFSTAGRINMNYEIVPFTYITRNTGLRAVLKAERLIVMPDSAAGSYKNGSGDTNIGTDNNNNFHVPIDADQTLAAFNDYFTRTNDIFRSAAQICSMFLYPAKDAPVSASLGSGPKWIKDDANIKSFWATHRITGDNSRERPYTTIYPRLTTQSNTFMAHVWVQKLQKTPATPQDTWVEGRDQITSEYRGSAVLERYVDPNDTSLPDFATNTSATLCPYYKFRIIRTSQFSP